MPSNHLVFLNLELVLISKETLGFPMLYYKLKEAYEANWQDNCQSIIIDKQSIDTVTHGT